MNHHTTGSLIKQPLRSIAYLLALFVIIRSPASIPGAMGHRLLLQRNYYYQLTKHFSSGSFFSSTCLPAKALVASTPTQDTSTLRRPMSTTTRAKHYESYGDYRADADALEDPKLPFYAAQDSIERLPVPSLKETCDRFLPTALPLASTPEEAASLEEVVKAFPQQAQHLQKRLLQRQKENPNSSWLQHWWNTLAYLTFRDPIVVHVSYFFRCDDDPKLNDLLVQEKNTPTTNNAPPPYQACLARSAALLPVGIRYAQTIRTNETEPATMGRGKGRVTLCSTQCKYMFHACRIPQRDHDSYRLYFPEEHQQQPATVVVAVRGQFFSVAMPPVEKNRSQEYSQEQWRTILQSIIEQATTNNNDDNNINNNNANLPPSMGWLTGMNRDDWAAARDILLDQGGEPMTEALETLESSLFMLCMDVDEDIRTDRDRALQFWLGRSDTTSSDYHNRWYDKSAAVLVTKDGKLGFQGEHSMLDGMPFVEFCDTMVSEGTVEDDCLASDSGLSADDINLPQVTNIFQAAFDSLSSSAKTAIDACLTKAKADLTSLTDDYEMDVQHYQEYGSSVMKKAGFSPDAYTQQAMQLASYRMFGESLATYESTQVRKFLHGRTETTRTVSPASQAFCKTMDKKNHGDTAEANKSPEELRAYRFQLLQEACQSHIKYIRNAISAQGVDRHFFGLSMAIQDGEPKPDLLLHPLYEKSKQFRLSTSSLPNMAVGFGPVVADGLGVGYEAKPDSCIFHITARKEHGWTPQYQACLGEALDDMRNLLDFGESETPRSRL